MTREEFLFANNKDVAYKKVVSKVIKNILEDFSLSNNVDDNFISSTFENIVGCDGVKDFRTKFENNNDMGEFIAVTTDKVKDMNDVIVNNMSEEQFYIEMNAKDEDDEDIIDSSIEQALQQPEFKITGDDLKNAIMDLFKKDIERHKEREEQEDEVLNSLDDDEDLDDILNELEEDEQDEDTDSDDINDEEFSIEENYIVKLADTISISEATRNNDTTGSYASDVAITYATILEFARYCDFIDKERYTEILQDINTEYEKTLL